MKCLVVHDRAEVATQICTLIEDWLGGMAEVHVASDLIGARRCLQEHVFDLLIVDLTIPFILGKSQADFRVADQLLTELFATTALNPPGDVIGLSRDVDALQSLDTSINSHLMATIREDAEGSWKQQLRDKITYAMRASVARSVIANQHYLYDALIVTAMDKEMEPYLSLVEMSPAPHFNGAQEFLFRDKSSKIRKGVAFSVGRSGQPSAASLTQALIMSFRPRFAMMSGYCGGVKGKVKFADLVFFEASYAWDYGKWSEELDPVTNEKRSTFYSRPNPIDITDLDTHRIARAIKMSDFSKRPHLLRLAEEKSRGKIAGFDIHVCPAASGSAVVADDDIVRKIRGLNESIWAVDMESYGFYHAAKYTPVVRPEFICVKSVSDFCNGEKGDDFHDACSAISARAVIEMLTRHCVF